MIRFITWLQQRFAPQAKWFGRWLGDAGERLAAKHLRGLGYRILHRQYRSSFGEIDLIVRDQDSIVFVEVKTRRSTAAGTPMEAVHREKQAQITRLALAYLKRRNLLNHRARFDVVSIVWPAIAGETPQLTHIQNAFEASGEGRMFG